MRRVGAGIGVIAVMLAAGSSARADRPITGGSAVPAGTWPDLAAILTGSDGSTQLCSGTLVAPTVVLTAGHCDLTGLGHPLPTNILIGTNTLADDGGGTVIPIAAGYVYPDSQSSIDIAALVLASPATETPRAIATGWARAEIVNGAQVTIAGYGATDGSAMDYPMVEQQATIAITDYDCASTTAGCNVLARPDGELGAGGNGVDACNGDSGGPMYLATSFGTFLAATTSRAYANATTTCGGGGIYERPDKIVDWIEQQTGVPIARAPEPTAAPITAVRGTPGETMIVPDDPLSTSHSFAITVPPLTGTAAVDAYGDVRVCTGASAAGSDAVTITVTDTTAPARTAAIAIPIAVTAAAASDDGPCDPSFGDDGGCCDSGHAAGGTAIPLAAVLAALLARRRRG